ncbi:Uncharacterised protein [Citrobacter koseri]|nr:Uncharacterised protein [Citrobacter koseri]STT23491.1 Uncharacterised protein [Citrobacter koseri]
MQYVTQLLTTISGVLNGLLVFTDNVGDGTGEQNCFIFC